MIRNGSRLKFQIKHGLNRLRMRVREVLAGTQPEQLSEISEATVDDHSVRIDVDVPAAPGPDQIIPLLVYNEPWHQAGQPAESLRENDDEECGDMALEPSCQAKQSLAFQEPQKEDEGEVLPCLERKLPAWGWRSK